LTAYAVCSYFVLILSSSSIWNGARQLAHLQTQHERSAEGSFPYWFALIEEKCTGADYDKIREDDIFDITGLMTFAPEKQLTIVIHHSDGKIEKILVNHTYNKNQIDWFKAGSALNAMGKSKPKTTTSAKPKAKAAAKKSPAKKVAKKSKPAAKKKVVKKAAPKKKVAKKAVKKSAKKVAKKVVKKAAKKKGKR